MQNSTTRKILSIFVLILGLAAGFTGCSRRGPSPSTDSTQIASPKKHEHHPPHGGTPVVLGQEQFHLEFVLDPSSGVLRVYVLDGEMERFIRLEAPNFELQVMYGKRKEFLKLSAIADVATGETVGDTSLFEGKAGWLKGLTHFRGVVKAIQIHKAAFNRVEFDFPDGNDKDEKRAIP